MNYQDTQTITMVKVSEILPDPHQTRQQHSDEANNELAASVKENGVLQPIMIRPFEHGKATKYKIVFGHRRFLAALVNKMELIPADIRTMTDDEALELQITENLQRKDVHPMDEAIAFKQLLDKGKSIAEIAARVGKSEFYARQRIKLCALSVEWQNTLYRGKVSVSDALKIAVFDEKIQQQLLADQNQFRDNIEINIWQLNKYRGDLTKASFPLDDPDLNKEMGACTICQFNTANALLFANDAEAKCTKLECYSGKVQAFFDREIKQVVDDPEVILVNDSYGSSKDKVTDALKKDGHVIYNHNQYTTVRAPEPLDKDEWMYDNEDNFETDEEAEREFKIDLYENAREIEEHQEAVESGKYQKAFVIAGEDKGKYVFVKLSNSAKQTLSTDQEENKGTITVAQIDDEIFRIEEKEKRAKQIDENKIWDEIKKQFNPASNASVLKDEFTQVEMDAICQTAFNKINYSNQDKFRNLFKIDQGKFSKIVFKNIDEITFRQILRFFFLSELPPSILYSGFDQDATQSLRVAEEYFPGLLKDAKQINADKIAKRSESVKNRIDELKKKKKELQAASKSTKKKTA